MSQLAGLAKSVRKDSSLSRIVTGGLSEPDTEDVAEQATTPELQKVPSPKKPKKVPLTKSRNPAWKAYSLFLKKETHSEMNFLLRRQDKGEDMSDLVQRLVEKWVATNR